MTDEPQKTKKQVIDQYLVVEYLARALADCYDARSASLACSDDEHPDHIDALGSRSAAHMEQLRGILNSMDAVEEDTVWSASIFEAAQKLWPQGETTP